MALGINLEILAADNLIPNVWLSSGGFPGKLTSWRNLEKIGWKEPD